MPHFVASSLNQISYPATYEDIIYHFEVYGNNDSIISVSIKKEKFFLKKCKNAKMQTIVKPEKYTRIPQIWILQKALIGYMKLSNAKTISQNIYKKNQTQQETFLYAIKDNIFFKNLFKNKDNKKIYLEIGFGSGRHILNKAKNNPDDIFIGLEVHYPSIEQVSKLAKNNNITNLYLQKCDARIFLELLPSNSIASIYIHFPVPWDKKPHRRIYSNKFLKQTKRVLDKNATLELRTDSIKYYEYVKELFKQKNQKIDITKNKEIDITSKYEDRWKTLKKNIYDIIFTNKKISKLKENKFSFDFPKEIKQTQEIQTKSRKYKNYFYNIQDIYTNKEISILKISFGCFDKAMNNYIQLSKEQQTSYVIPPIPSKCNKKSHSKIVKLLQKS